MRVRILRPEDEEPDYHVVQDGSNNYICARAEAFEVDPTMHSRYSVPDELLHAKIYGPLGDIPDTYPGGGYDAMTDENGIAHFPAIYEAAFGPSPGSFNRLAVWTDVSPVDRAVHGFYGIEAMDTECEYEGPGEEEETLLRVARTSLAARSIIKTTKKSSVTLLPRIWNLNRQTKDKKFVQFEGNGLRRFNRNFHLCLEKVDTEFTSVKPKAIWVSHDHKITWTPKPTLVCESPVPRTYCFVLRTDFDNPGGPNEQRTNPLEYLCSAAAWNPHGTNRLIRNPKNKLLSGEKAPEYFTATPA